MKRFFSKHLAAVTVAVATASALLMVSQGAMAGSSEMEAARTEHAERMKLVGRTARFDEMPAPPVAADPAPVTREEWAARAALTGRTARHDEVAPAAVAADPEPSTEAELVQAYTERMQLIGRTVPANELAMLRNSVQQRSAQVRSSASGS